MNDSRAPSDDLSFDLTRPLPAAAGVTLTDEQQDIVNYPPTSTVIVDAGAGTGKTFTLAEYARRYKNKRGIYLAFNTDIVEQARASMPPSVSAFTVNSLAYRALSVSRHKERLVTRIRRQSLRQADIPLLSEHLSPDRMTRCILDGLTNFCNDGGNELLPRHCGLDLAPKEVQRTEMPRIAAVIKRFLNYQDSGLPFTHDVYLKYYEMHVGLDKSYDFVLLDEAQDSNGVTLSLITKSGLPTVIVGDARQSIYQFRGAINAMTTIEAPRLPLSMSWRFGPNVANLANAILAESEEKILQKLRGREDRNTTIEAYSGRAPARSMLLARTNGRLLEGLVALAGPPKPTVVPDNSAVAPIAMTGDQAPPQTAVAAPPPGAASPSTATFHVAGGFDVLAKQILSALALSKGDDRNVKDAYVRGFKTWGEMLEEAEYDDPDARKLVKIVTDYGDGLPDLMHRLGKRHCQHHRDAQIILSTAHKAKGLESDCVVILDDFSTPLEMKARLLDDKLSHEAYEQELNLLYVAATRAKYRLLLSQALFKWHQSKEHQYPKAPAISAAA